MVIKGEEKKHCFPQSQQNFQSSCSSKTPQTGLKLVQKVQVQEKGDTFSQSLRGTMVHMHFCHYTPMIHSIISFLSLPNFVMYLKTEMILYIVDTLYPLSIEHHVTMC